MDVARRKADGGRPTGGACVDSALQSAPHTPLPGPGHAPGTEGPDRSAMSRADSDAFAITFVPASEQRGGAVVLCVRSIKYTKLSQSLMSAAAAVASASRPTSKRLPTSQGSRFEIPCEFAGKRLVPPIDCVSGPRMRTIPTIPKTLCMACGQPSHLRTNLHTVTECMVMNFERHGDLRPGLTGRPNPQGRPSCAVPGGHVTWHAARHAATRKR